MEISLGGFLERWDGSKQKILSMRYYLERGNGACFRYWPINQYHQIDSQMDIICQLADQGQDSRLLLIRQDDSKVLSRNGDNARK